jgi:hypothetical protein
MENYLYVCQYCSKQYKPNRRKKQKYCSNSCRTRAFILRKGKGLGLIKPETNNPGIGKIDKMSVPGVGNAVAGNLISEGIIHAAKAIFTKEEDKPATKKDVKNMIDAINGRYHPIRNLQTRNDGAIPYYDFETKEVIYQIRRRW